MNPSVKDVKRGVVELRGVGGKNKKPTPFVVEIRLNTKYIKNDWHSWGSYRSLKIAEATLATMQRKSIAGIEFRLKPEDV